MSVSVAVGECAAQPASARRSAIEYNETVFAFMSADTSMCNVQRQHPETCAVFGTDCKRSDCGKVDQMCAEATAGKSKAQCD